MSERLIMLDVPGVLFSDRSAARTGGIPNTGTLRDVRFFDPIALGFLRRLFGIAGARVVVSDAWRRGTPAAILQQLDLQVEGMTPRTGGGHGTEIDAWFAGREAPSAWVILSTAAPETFSAAQRERLVRVDPAEGLTVENFRQALDILGVACPRPLRPIRAWTPTSRPSCGICSNSRAKRRRAFCLPPLKTRWWTAPSRWMGSPH